MMDLGHEEKKIMTIMPRILTFALALSFGATLYPQTLSPTANGVTVPRLVRFSGTEPLVRVYTEAASQAAVRARARSLGWTRWRRPHPSRMRRRWTAAHRCESHLRKSG